MGDLSAYGADFDDEDSAWVWILALEEGGLSLSPVIESRRSALWIQNDREGSADGVRVSFWLQEGDEAARLQDAAARLSVRGGPALSRWTDAEERAAAGWQTQHPALEIGERLRIAPPWLGGEAADRIEIIIEPGAAFGAGGHVTTRLCLEALEGVVRPGDFVADFGCGSGVLGFAALGLGAARALLVDREEAAVEAARRDAERNGVSDRVRVLRGELDQLGPGPFDLVLANIYGQRLLDLLPELVARLGPQGRLVLGGILEEHEEEIVAALETARGGRIERRAEAAFRSLVSYG